MYIADKNAHKIRRVDPSGIITTFAGTGYKVGYGDGAFGGDGGQATSAYLNYPTGVAVGPDGSVYIADNANNRIRRVTSDGRIDTVAGGGIQTGNLGDGGPATQAGLEQPTDVAVGPDGSFYIADSKHLRIRRVSPDGMIRTIAGDGNFCNYSVTTNVSHPSAID